jgi:anti-sigma factor RsiW
MNDVVDEALAKLPRSTAPASLHARLAATAPSTRARRDRIVRTATSAVASLAIAAALCVVFVRTHDASERAQYAIDDVVNDHVRLLARERPFDVESGGIHQVKPWFQGKLDFAPAVRYAGDADFPLVGGAVGFVVDRRAAEFGFTRRLHKITLLVFEAQDAAWPTSTEPDAQIVRGYHALGWRDGALAFALVSDVDAADLAELAHRIRTAG